MVNDPLADLLVRIKNSRLAKHQELVVPYSRLKEELVKLLVKIGSVGEFKVKDNKIIIYQPRIAVVRRLSKPGRRLYARTRDLIRYCRGQGQTILSTSKGLMTAKEAVKKGLGGELLCRII